MHLTPPLAFLSIIPARNCRTCRTVALIQFSRSAFSPPSAPTSVSNIFRQWVSSRGQRLQCLYIYHHLPPPPRLVPLRRPQDHIASGTCSVQSSAGGSDHPMLFCLTPSPSALVSDDTSPPPDPTGHDP